MKLPITHEIVNRSIAMHARYGGGAMVLPLTYKNTELALAAQSEFTGIESEKRTDDMAFNMSAKYVAALLVSEPKFISQTNLQKIGSDENLKLEDFLESYDEFPTTDQPLNERAAAFFEMGDEGFKKFLKAGLMGVYIEHNREAEGAVPPIFTLSSN